jgi:hypothetical protein
MEEGSGKMEERSKTPLMTEQRRGVRAYSKKKDGSWKIENEAVIAINGKFLNLEH